MKKGFKAIFPLVLGIFMLAQALPAQNNLILSGKIYNGVTKKPLDFATIIIFELQKKAYSQNDGSYSIEIPKAGAYTIGVTSPGLRPVKTQVHISQNTEKNFILQSIRLIGGEITISAERDVQKVSRQTMTVQDLKDTPATLGDPLNALTTLPGINRTFGFLGNLVIRALAGSQATSNYYLIDGLPMLYPQHFGAIHSVVSLDLIREIDLFASAHPVEYGHAIGAVISFNTIDKVKEEGGFVSMNLISSNIEYHQPFGDGGYVVIAGRLGYLTLLIPTILSWFNVEVPELPEYYDYQFKINYFLDKKGRHALTFLTLGATDQWKIATTDNASETDKNKAIDEGQDPFNFAWKFAIANSFHSMGLYYTYIPSRRFYFQQLLLASFNRYDTFIDNLNLPSQIRGIGLNSAQNIYGYKNKLKFEWWQNISELRAGLEYTLYDFNADVKSAIPTKNDFATLNVFSPGDFELYQTNFNLINQGFAAYLENKFTAGGLKIIPGVRWDFLKGKGSGIYNQKYISDSFQMAPTYNYHGLVAYEFPTETTLAVAGGYYNSYIQANPVWFQNEPETAAAYYIEPEKSIHRVVSLEQKLNLTTIRIEAFYNNLFNMMVLDQRDPNRLDKWGNPMITRNTGHGASKGIEFMVRRDRFQGRSGFYGWLSYAYTRADYNNGLPALNLTNQDLIKPDGTPGQYTPEELAKINQADNEQHANNFEIIHYVKLVA
jgi:hypothetical protein